MFYKVGLQQFQLHVDWQMVGCHLRIAGLEFAADLGIEDIDLGLVLHEEDVVDADLGVEGRVLQLSSTYFPNTPTL